MNEPDAEPEEKQRRISLGLVLPLVVIAAAMAGVLVLLVNHHSSLALPGNAKSRTAAGYDGQLLSPIRQAPSFGGLRDYTGEPVRLADYRGKAVLVTFLYTHCPNVCPLITAELHDTLEKLGPQKSKHVQIVAVSVDPHHDSVKSVASFLKVHGMTGKMKYLIGDANQLGPVWQAWNVGSTPDSVDPEFVAHSSLVYGIDAGGRLTTIYPANFQPAQIIHDLPQLEKG